MFNTIELWSIQIRHVWYWIPICYRRRKMREFVKFLAGVDDTELEALLGRCRDWQAAGGLRLARINYRWWLFLEHDNTYVCCSRVSCSLCTSPVIIISDTRPFSPDLDYTNHNKIVSPFFAPSLFRWYSESCIRWWCIRTIDLKPANMAYSLIF